MPSLLHESLLLLFRNRPGLAPLLLRKALGVALPAWTEVRIESAELTDVAPTEYRADLVILLVDGVPVLGIVLEVQLDRDVRKRLSWPVYLTTLRARLQCPTCLLVVAPNRGVARWCAKAIEVGPGFVLKPRVLGPSGVPVVTSLDEARSEPELAVLSALAHADSPVGTEAAFAAIAGAVGLDEERARLYYDLVMAALPVAARRALEEGMASGTWEYQSEFARKYVAQGVAQGMARGEAEALLVVLDARGVRVDAEADARIRACTDLLRTWLRRAASAHTVAEVFADA